MDITEGSTGSDRRLLLREAVLEALSVAADQDASTHFCRRQPKRRYGSHVAGDR